MNNIEQGIRGLAEKVKTLKSSIETEEATKSAFVMPFLQVMGYDVFNPLEVVPEFVADQSTKKGEKVDYCIKKDGKAIIIIECKQWEQNLDLHGTQLERYFGFVNARFGILTNGITYKFFSDLVAPNKMDLKPFFEFDLENLKESVFSELNKFQRDNFDTDAIVNSAGQLKYMREIRGLFEKEIRDPSPSFVKHFASQVYEGRLTERILTEFTSLVKRVIGQVFNETINERLHKALTKEEVQQKGEGIPIDSKPEQKSDSDVYFHDPERGIVTTKEEMAGFEIVIDILKNVINPDRIAHRDTKSYYGILLDDNNRKPICRLYLNTSNKYIGLFDEEKNENKQPIEKLAHIYKYTESILRTVQFYLFQEQG